MAWIAFTVSFALPKLSYILSVLNDPFGWGWRLLGLNGSTQTVNIAGFSTLIQVALLLVGLLWSVRVSMKLSETAGKKPSRLNLPVALFSLVFTLAMLWLLVG